MPNWCENRISVLGVREEVTFFLHSLLGVPQAFKANEVQDFSDKEVELRIALEQFPTFRLSSLLPVPLNLRREASGEAVYNWCIEFWGTKWDAELEVCHTSLDLEPIDGVYYMEIDFEVDTAWGPPIEWLRRVSKMFPTLDFSIVYYESGMAYAGSAYCREGEIVEELDLQAELDEDSYWEFLIENFGITKEELKEEGLIREENHDE